MWLVCLVSDFWKSDSFGRWRFWSSSKKIQLLECNMCWVWVVPVPSAGAGGHRLRHVRQGLILKSERSTGRMMIGWWQYWEWFKVTLVAVFGFIWIYLDIFGDCWQIKMVWMCQGEVLLKAVCLWPGRLGIFEMAVNLDNRFDCFCILLSCWCTSKVFESWESMGCGCL